MKRINYIFFIILFWTSKTYSQGCSQCKLVAEQGSELDENSFGSGINTGILYLMIIPYLLLMFLLRKQIVAFFKSKFSK
jgi:hypothetical protein